MPKGMRKIPIRIMLKVGAMLGNGLKSMYDSRKYVVEAAVPPGFCVLLVQSVPGVQPGVLFVKLML